LQLTHRNVPAIPGEQLPKVLSELVLHIGGWGQFRLAQLLTRRQLDAIGRESVVDQTDSDLLGSAMTLVNGYQHSTHINLRSIGIIPRPSAQARG
jgi:hypothetical protein